MANATDASPISSLLGIPCISENIPKIFAPREFRRLTDGVNRVVADAPRDFLRFDFAALGAPLLEITPQFDKWTEHRKMG